MFAPKGPLKNPHIQTLYPTLWKKNPTLSYTQEIFTLPDGDFIEPFWYEKNLQKPIVVLLHGLAGSYKSAYIPSLVLRLYQNGFSPVVMHFRGCGTLANRLARSYHSGDTLDLRTFLQTLSRRSNDVSCIGFSLGANVLLKYLGEYAGDTKLRNAIAVSPPFRLDVAARRLDKGFAKVYRNVILKELKTMLLYKAQKFDLDLTPRQIRRIRTFREFDALYTAPIHGFASIEEYYETSSCYTYIPSIRTRTLILHAKDDPFLTPQAVPPTRYFPANVSLKLTRYGGHVGFIDGTWRKPNLWIDQKVEEFLQER